MNYALSVACRLNSSLEILKLELDSRGESVNRKDSIWEKEKDLAENGLLVSIGGNGTPAEYGNQFRSFAEWVTGSLDLYKRELSQLLYPTFVYTYVTMIQLEAGTAAQDLLTESKDLFLEQTTDRNRREILLKEIHEFSKITSPEQLHESTIISNVLKQKVLLTLSSFTYDLMLQYLRHEKLVLITSLINRWFSLSIVQDFSSDFMSFWSATANVDVSLATPSSTMQGKLNLELLKDCSYLKVQEGKLRRKIAVLEELDEEEITKVQKNELEALRGQLSKLLNRGIQSAIPLPPKHPSEALEEGEPDLDESLSLTPNCAFVSIINSRDSLNSVTLTSDLGSVVGGFSDSVIRVFDIENGSSRHLCGNTGPVYSVSLSQTKSNLLVSSSGDGLIRLWSMELASNLAVYPGHMLPVWDVSFAPIFGHYFASVGADKTCRLWDTERKTCLRVFAGHSSDVEVVKWHPNCQLIASGSADHHIRLWDVASGSCVSILSGHKSPITCLEFSPGGDVLVSGDADGEVLFWDFNAGSGSYEKIGRHHGPVWSVAMNDLICVTGGDDCCVRLWDVQNRNPLATWGTKATPVSYVGITNGLIVGAGAFSV